MTGDSSRRLKYFFVLVCLFLLVLTWTFYGDLPDTHSMLAFLEISQKINNSGLLVNDVSGVWSQVQGRKALLYSAFFDDRFSPPIVRVVAQVECEPKLPFFCAFHSSREIRDSGGNSNAKRILVEASLMNINKGCNGAFEGYFIVCKLSGAAKILRPSGVQIFGQKSVPEEWNRMTPILPIYYSKSQLATRNANQNQHEHGLAICINRLFNWSDWILLILFIEYYLLQGATKFVVYHRSWTKDVDTVIKYYQKRGILELMPHPRLPNLIDDNVLQQQIPLMNDCIYSLRGRAKFVSVLDLDEFLLPTNTSQTLLEFANRVSSGRLASTGAIMFRNIFFASLFPDSGKLADIAEEDSQHRILSNLSRNFVGTVQCIGEPHRFHERSKYIVRPEAILRASVHEIWEYVPELQGKRETEILVDPTEAAMFHLRKINDDFDERTQTQTCEQNSRQNNARSPFASLSSSQTLMTRIKSALCCENALT